MENQVNTDEQNGQKIGHNLVNQPTNIQVKPRVNLWMISTLVFALLLLVTVGIFAVNYNKMKKDQSHLPDITPETSPTPTNSLKLEDFTNIELLGENDNYSVYLINPKSEDTLERTGEIIVYEKKTKVVHKIDGSFSIFGATIVFDDGRGEYVLLSTGTYTLRGAIVISLVNKKQAVRDFCVSGNHIFWRDFIVYSNCDTFQNRPWGSGEAPSVTVVDLVNDQTKILFKSDLTRHYWVNKIENDTLYYEEVFVERETDWNSEELQKTVTKTYNLLSL